MCASATVLMMHCSSKTWSDVIERYRLEKVDKKSLKKDLAHLKTLGKFFGDIPLHQIANSLIFDFIQHRKQSGKVSNASINRELEILRHIFNLAVNEWEWLPKAPKIRMLKEAPPRVRFLGFQEADKLMLALPPHLQPFVQFALSTGCRLSEIRCMEWSRVDLKRNVAWLNHGSTKNGAARGIPLNNDAMIALSMVKGQHPRWVFTYQGEPMSVLGSAWKRSLKRAGIQDFRFHDLRHTWASWHVMSGTSLAELMELGGWKTVDCVLRYAHLAPDHLKDAASRIERIKPSGHKKTALRAVSLSIGAPGEIRTPDQVVRRSLFTPV